MTLANDPFDRLRHQLGQAAARQSTIASLAASPRPRRWPWMRPLGIAVVGVLATSSGAAAVLINYTSTSKLSAAARPDAPAAQNLTSLNKVLDALPAQIPRGAPTADSAGAARSASSGPILGTTVSRGVVSVDVTLTTNRICLAASVTADRRGEVGCAPLPLSADRLAFVQGNDADQAWVAAAAPDGVSDVQVTADTGAVDTALIDRNVAIAVLPGAHDIIKISWQRPDGTRHTQTVADGPDNATQATTRPLER